MKIRIAKESDLPTLVDLWLEMMQEHQRFDPRIELSSTSAAAYESYLLLHCRGARSLLLVAENETGIEGFCCSYICSNLPMFRPAEFGFLSDIYVRPDCRGRGVGTAMFDRTVEWLREQGAKSLHLQVYHLNEMGKVYWRSRGLTPFVDRMWMKLSEE